MYGMHLRKIFIALFLTSIIPALIALSGCGSGISVSKKSEPNQFPGTQIEKMQGRNIYDDLNAALKATGFPIKLPRETLGGKFKNAVVTKLRIPGGEHSIALNYSNGLDFFAQRSPDPTSFQARINSIKETNVKSGAPADLNAPRLIDISGHQGMAWTHSSLYWWDSGVEYRLSGPFSNDEQALKVADSVYQK
jgi:hypothetical protein